ncbi:MAG: site-specific tyrosine recombinase XerC [Planctomyces sp.]|nr:site-specific tyrosine recombinase XerC [Planctomyces sp.]
MKYKFLKNVGNPDDPQGCLVLMNKYLEWMLIRNYSEHTVETRRFYLGFFIRWAEERGVVQPCEVTKQVIQRYQRFIYHYRKRNGDPLSVRSQHGRLIPIRAWFKWLARENFILFNPASEIELPKLEYRLPKHVLTVNEAEQVIAQANVKTPLGVRDRAILETLYSTGIRRTELSNLHVYDLDPDRGTVIVRQGKGRKDRMIPIGERALAWIGKYLDEVRPTMIVGHNSEDVLFLNHLGQQINPDALTLLVRRYVDQSEIGKRGACHLFRHTMATLMHDNGADIRFIQAMLGHSKLTTTEIYTQVSIKKLKEIHTATHPARLKDTTQPKKRKRKPKSAKPTPAPEGKTEAESVQ